MLERTYIVPLRKGWAKAPKYRRSKKAVNTLREFLCRHMKSEDIKIMPELNIEIWKDGIKCPPPRVKISVVKGDDNVVKAQLFGKEFPKEEVEEKKSVVTKLKEKVVGEKKEEKKAVPAEPKKVVEKKPVAVKAPEKVKPVENKVEPAK